MFLILQVFWVNFILFVWFETDSFIEYSKIFRLSKFFKVDSYEKYKKETNPKINYLSYIRQKYPSFITRLLSCVPCFGFWVVLVVTLIFNSLVIMPIIYLIYYYY